MARLPVEERAAFLSRLVKKNLSATLERLGQKKRAALMNNLLPPIARHFPLEDVDILGAFAGLDGPRSPGWETTWPVCIAHCHRGHVTRRG